MPVRTGGLRHGKKPIRGPDEGVTAYLTGAVCSKKKKKKIRVGCMQKEKSDSSLTVAGPIRSCNPLRAIVRRKTGTLQYIKRIIEDPGEGIRRDACILYVIIQICVIINSRKTMI